MRAVRSFLVIVLLSLLGIGFGSDLVTLAFTARPDYPPVPTLHREPANNDDGGFPVDLSAIFQVCEMCPDPELVPSFSVASELGVFLHSGELWVYAVDLEIPGRGFNWKFERTYRSGLISRGPLGSSWEHNYNRRLVEVNGVNLSYILENIFPQAKRGDVFRMDGYGRIDIYVRNTDGSYGTPAGFYMTLVRNPDGTFVERNRTGGKALYGQPDSQGIARLAALNDRNGNTMRFQYNARNQLVRVIDTLGRPIDYIYNNDGLLEEVRDFLGRSIRFAYDTQIERIGSERHPRFNLVAVTSPVVAGTPNGNDFPQGKSVKYAYAADFDRERFNHNLLTISAPKEVATSGPARVTVTYDTNINSPNVDRVLSMTIGGTNSTGIPAGGTIRYEYRSLGAPRAGDFNTAVSQTTVTDRNGNQTEYQFNQLGNIVRVKEFTNRNVRSSDPEFYERRYEYNKDSEITKVIYPEGNSLEYAYDDKNADRFQQGNRLSETRRADAKRRGDQASLKTTATFEPIYNQTRAVTEARGNDSGYVPQNGGANFAQRYTTTYTFDYQEGNNLAALAKQFGLTETQVRQLLQQSGIPMGLGDVNGDGRTDQIAGNVIRIERPTVQLLTACTGDEPTAANTNCSLQARLEGTSQQPIVELYQYNQFGQMTKRSDTEDNVDIYDYYPENDPDGDGKDLTQGVSTGPFGYLKEEVRDAVSSPERNSKTNPDPVKIKRSYFYDRVGNVIKEIDGRGIATEYSVNQLNQVVEITRAASVSLALNNTEEPAWRACFQASSEIGELVECQAGMFPFRYRTRVFYDFNNNVVKREIENKDSNNQSVAGNFIEYTFAYDILDNLIEETQEVSETPREILTTKYRYDRNENRVLEISPVANLPTGNLERQLSNVVSYVFDERDLLFTSTRGGLTDQFKALTAHADIPERTLIPNSPDLSVFSRIYDLNRNLVESIDGTDNTGDGRPEVTTYLYDGFDRQVSVIDAVGNQSFTQYDPASNVIRASRFGPVGGKSPTSNAAANFKQPLKLEDFKQPMLNQAESKYDELNRMFERNDKLFVYQGVEYKRAPVLQDGPLGVSNDGIVVTRYEYDRSSRRTFSIEDDLSVFQTRYDGVNRTIREIDPELNEVLYSYDDNSNTVKIVEVEITQRADVRAGKVPDLRETFTTINTYDSLNRLIRTADNLGQTTRYHYDSRDNLIFTSDAQYSQNDSDLIADPLGLFPAPEQDSRGVTEINLDGNTMEYFYDGINRKISEVRHLRVDGQGKNDIDTSNPANPDGLIVIDSDWDANSRLVAMADDGSLQGDQNTSIGIIESTNPQGNVTRYLYDDLNRQSREIFDDNTCNVYGYDADDNLIQVIDENSSIIRNTHDGINRLVRNDIERATAATPHPAGCFKDSSVTWQVIGTTVQEFEYDGLSRMTRSFDNNEPEDISDDATVTYAYDSLNRLLEEVQNGHAISSRWAGDYRRISLVYPNGRELEYTFDNLDRINTIKDKGAAQNTVDYDYVGSRRVLERTSANGARLTHLDDAHQNDAGYDGLRRTVKIRHLRSDNSLIVGFTHTYDRVNNKLLEEKLHDSPNSELYHYDSGYRIVDFQRGNIDAGKDAVVTPSPNSLQLHRWTLDGVSNWQQNVLTTSGSTTIETRQHSSLNEASQVGTLSALYDDNGNQIDSGILLFRWDYANRLRTVTRKSDNAPMAVYFYDALGRRIRKVVTEFADASGTTHFYLDGWRQIEERDSTSVLKQQYVYGIDIDEPLALDRNLEGDSTAIAISGQRLFYHQNELFSVFALTDTSGTILEGYQYDAYGSQVVYGRGDNGVVDFGGDDQITVEGISKLHNPYAFTGRFLDGEAGLYFVRARYLSPPLGRFLQRDPLGYRDGLNLYQYSVSNPLRYRDPLGLQVTEEDCKKTVEDALASDPVVTTIMGNIRRIGDLERQLEGRRTCLVPEISCQCCRPRTRTPGNYSPVSRNIRMCWDNNRSTQSLVEVLRHELVHAYDDCNVGLTGDCRNRACTEVRAMALSGECQEGGRYRRGNGARGTINFVPTETFEECVRRGATASTIRPGTGCTPADIDWAMQNCFPGPQEPSVQTR